MAVLQKTFTGAKSWIYAYEPETKQQFTMWAFEDKPNPTKAVCGKSASKQIVDGFFGKTDHVAIVPLEQRCPVNSEWYTTISLEQFEKQTRKERISVHHGNASIRTSAQISSFLNG